MMKPRVMLGLLIAGDDLTRLLDANAAAIVELLAERECEELRHTRYVFSLISQFRDALEADDGEALRNALDSAKSDLADTVARMEEYSV